MTFYTIRIENDTKSLARQFIIKHSTSEHIESLQIMRKYLEKIGNDIGASTRYFRPEGYAGGDACALPPPYINMNMRWYGMIVSRHVVFLFGGGIKTRRTAQECPNVRKHFYQANRLAKIIHYAIMEGDIVIDNEARTLIFDPEYKLQL